MSIQANRALFVCGVAGGVLAFMGASGFGQSVPSGGVGGVAGGGAGSGAPVTPSGGGQTLELSDGWYKDAVFYQVFVRSFKDSSQGAKAKDGIGDIAGLIEKLDYINDGKPGGNDLGATAIWLLPITQSPSYHGYDTTDYMEVESDYGTNADFLKLLEACHARGVRVVIDMVLNHCSDRHQWFRDAVAGKDGKQDWFVFSDRDLAYKGPWGQKVWHRTRGGAGGGGASGGGKVDSARAFYYGVFSDRMPDLNFRNEAVTNEMKKVMRFWLKDMKVDGFRLDAIRHLVEDGQKQENTDGTYAWLAEFQQFMRETKPGAVSIGEVWSDTKTVASYVGDSMDTAFEFDLAGKIIEGLKVGGTTGAGMIRGQVGKTLEAFGERPFATFLTNHDQPRVMHMFGDDERKAKLAGVILMTLPGVPFVYYGEEIGLSADKPDEQIRTPMPWSNGLYGGFSGARPWMAMKPGWGGRNVATLLEKDVSILNVYRKAIALRQAYSELRAGGMTFVDVGEGVPMLVFDRATMEGGEDGGDGGADGAGVGAATKVSQKVRVIVNLSDSPAVADKHWGKDDVVLMEVGGQTGVKGVGGGVVRKVPAWGAVVLLVK